MPPRAEFKRISAEDARWLIERPDLQLIDVRDYASFARAHIASARHVTSRNLADVLLSLHKGRPVLIYCYHGNASQTYAQTFVDFGFREVYSLDGGFERWRQRMAAGSSGLSRPDART